VTPSHDHGHEHHRDHHAVPSDLTLRVKAFESLLLKKGLVDRVALDALIDTYDPQGGPAQERVAVGEDEHAVISVDSGRAPIEAVAHEFVRQPVSMITVIDRWLLPRRDECAVGFASQLLIEIGPRSLNQRRGRE
jgi:hypothetical protein